MFFFFTRRLFNPQCLFLFFRSFRTSLRPCWIVSWVRIDFIFCSHFVVIDRGLWLSRFSWWLAFVSLFFVWNLVCWLVSLLNLLFLVIFAIEFLIDSWQHVVLFRLIQLFLELVNSVVIHFCQLLIGLRRRLESKSSCSSWTFGSRSALFL